MEAFLIPLRLQSAGMSEPMAIRYFGQLTGMALPLIFFPTALTLSLSTNLVPVIAQQHAVGDHAAIQESLLDSLQATAMFTVPVTILLLALGIRVDDLFFHAHIPPGLFYPLVLGGFFLYFDITLSGVLRGLGRTDIPMRNDLAASAIEIVLIWVFSIRPQLAALGIPVAISIGFALSMIFNAVSLARLTQIAVNWRTILARPLAAVIPAGLALLLWHFLEANDHPARALNLFFSIGFSSLAYLISLHLTRRDVRNLF
jgi:stage V sporulation protein B